MRLLKVITLLLLVFTTSISAWAEDRITWIYIHFPPIQILSQPYLGEGFGDLLQNQLVNNIDNCEHDFVQASIARGLALFKSKQHVAYVALMKTPEREKYIDFSVPVYLMLPNGVLTTPDNVKRLTRYTDKDGHFLLEEAITQSDLRCGFIKGRAYGTAIDTILEKFQGHPNTFASAKGRIDAQLLPMLYAGRLDYIIGYPTEGQYFSRISNNGPAIASLPIEGMPDYQFGHVGLPKTEWGKRMLQRINPVVRQYRTSPELVSSCEFWLDDNAIARYRKFLKEAF